jgi:integrase
MAQEWEHVERVAVGGQATVAKFQKVVSQVAERVIGDSMPLQTVRQYFEDWLLSSARRTAPATAERYANTVRLFLKSLGSGADQSLRSLAPRHIELFLHHRLDEGVAPKTAVVDIKTLGSALRRAENFGCIDKNPVPAVKLPRAVSTTREVFSLEEIHQLVAAAPNQDWQTLILLGFYTGARLSDCARLSWDNVDAERKLIVYAQQKTGKVVAVPLHPDLLVHLVGLSEKGTLGPLCRTVGEQRQAGKHGLSEGFKRVVKRAGLDLMVVKGKGTRNFARRTFHSLRHSFSSMLASHGVSEEMRMRLTGHSSREIHQLYTHIDVGPLQQAIDTIPVRPQSPVSDGAR